jgi:hypothetical protein
MRQHQKRTPPYQTPFRSRPFQSHPPPNTLAPPTPAPCCPYLGHIRVKKSDVWTHSKNIDHFSPISSATMRRLKPTWVSPFASFLHKIYVQETFGGHKYMLAVRPYGRTACGSPQGRLGLSGRQGACAALASPTVVVLRSF